MFKTGQFDLLTSVFSSTLKSTDLINAT